MSHLGDLLEIDFVVKKRKNQRLLVKKLHLFEINDQKMAILSIMVDNLQSILNTNGRIKSASMKKSHSHKHVKKTEFE
jgi:hypothetical protein